MHRFVSFFVPFVPLWLILVSETPAADPTYWQDVRPILRRHCTACHSKRTVDEIDVSGGIALDTYEAVVKLPKKAIVRVGMSAESPLVRLLLESDVDKRMPRSASPLPPEKIAVLRQWIDSGAHEGKKPEEPVAVAATRGRLSRKQEVKLTTNAQAPAELAGKGSNGKLELALAVGPLAPVAAVAFSPDGKLLATGSYGRVVVWDLGSARPVKVLTNVLGAINDVRFSPEGKLLAVAGGQPSAKGDLRIYQVSDWKLLAVLGGHDDVVFSVAFRPDGKQLASASFDKTVRLWNIGDPGKHVSPERVLTGHSDFVYSVAYAPDGQWLVSAGKDRVVKLVEVATGKSRFTFSGMDQDVLAVAVSPDGKRVVSSGFESALYWWDPQTGQRVRVHGGHGVAVHELCFSKDGKLLASAGADKTVRLWNGENGSPKSTLAVGSVVYAVAVSPDGTRVASGSFDGLVRLWDVKTGRLLVSLLAVPAADWLAVTPEGYASNSPGLAKLGHWRQAGRDVPADPLAKALLRPEMVARAARGEALKPPTFEKEESPQRHKEHKELTKP